MIPFKDGCRVTSPMGERINPVDGKKEYHAGIDAVPLSGDNGVVISPIYCTVVAVSRGNERGKYVVLVAATTKQALVLQHFDEIYTTEGATLQQGTAIGLYGKTGKVTAKHLHIEAWKDYQSFKSGNRKNLVPITQILGIPNQVGTYKQNVDYDIIVENPFFYAEKPEDEWSWAKYKDALAVPLASEYGTTTALDSSKYDDFAILCNNRYLQNESSEIELKNSTTGSSTSLKMSFDAKTWNSSGISEGAIIKAYSKTEKKYLFFGRITKIKKSTSKFEIEAKGRLWYISQSDMTIQLKEGQNTASAIRALCNRVHMSHNICKMETALTSSMIFYKDKFANIIKKLIEHEETYSGKKYMFTYDYEQALLKVAEKGDERLSIDIDDIIELSLERDISTIKNVVYAYDSQAKVASAPISDAESVERYGAVIHYFSLDDATTSMQLRSFLELNKDALTSGELTCHGRWDIYPGAELVLNNTDPISFSDNGKLIVESVTHKIGDDFQTKIEFSTYKVAEMPSQEDVEEYTEENIARENDEALRLRWMYYESVEDVTADIYKRHETEFRKIINIYWTTYKAEILKNKIPADMQMAYDDIAKNYYGKIFVRNGSKGYVMLRKDEVDNVIRKAGAKLYQEKQILDKDWLGL